MSTKRKPDAESRRPAGRRRGTSRRLVGHAVALAAQLDIDVLLVRAGDKRDIKILQEARADHPQLRVIWLVVDEEHADADVPDLPEGDVTVGLPSADLDRAAVLELGLLLTVASGHLEADQSVLHLGSGRDRARLDEIVVTDPRRDLPWLARSQTVEILQSLATREFAQLLHLALRLAWQGREGAPIGTILVLGEPEQLEPHLRPLVLNPCAGHPRRARRIHDPEFFETLREFAAMDGAFVIDRKGVVEAAGVYIDAPASRARLLPGQGTRHAAAAAITAAVPDTLAAVISASSGAVTVFADGKPLLQLER